MWPLWHALRPFRREVVRRTRQGVYKIPLSDRYGVAAGLFLFGEFESDLMADALAFLRAHGKIPARGQGTLLDIGANNGVISISMLTNGEVARAVAIEPEPTNFALLQHNLALNDLADRVMGLQYAVSNAPATLQLEISPDNLGDHRIRSNASKAADNHARRVRDLAGESRRDTVTVQAERVDDLLAKVPSAYHDDISLIWIDIQGYESYAFQGAAQLLARGVPAVAEINPYMIRRAGVTPEQYRAVCSQFWSHFHVYRNGRFVQRPIDDLPKYFAELGYLWRESNVIFTR